MSASSTQQQQFKTITIPFDLFVRLLFNSRDSFLEDGDEFLREKMRVSHAMANLLKTWDKEQQHCVVLDPRTEFNADSIPLAYTKEAWKTSSVYLYAAKEKQQKTAEQVALREAKVMELAMKLSQDIGFDYDDSLVMARSWVMQRKVTKCMAYGVDISMLNEDVTKKTVLV